MDGKIYKSKGLGRKRLRNFSTCVGTEKLKTENNKKKKLFCRKEEPSYRSMFINIAVAFAVFKTIFIHIVWKAYCEKC